MQIDWLTVAAQVVNFLVLVWLLKHFLYGPITRAMDRREQRIAERLREAEDEKQKAEEEARAYRERQEELENQREKLITDARERASETRKSLEEKARGDVQQQREEWLRQIREQRESFLADVRRRAGEHFHALARRALGELADASLEAEMAKAFVGRLRRLDEKTRKRLADACKEASGRVVVRSRFPLEANEQRRITRAVHETIAEEAEVDYTESEEILCGIELSSGGQTVVWSLDGYFDTLEQRVAEVIDRLGAGRAAAAKS